MSAVPYEHDREEPPFDDDDQTLALPGRPRRRWLTGGSAALLALITCAIGFYVGIRVEKGQVSNTGGTARAFTPSALGGRSTGTSSAAGESRSGTSRAPGGAGFPGGGFGAGNASFGTISSVSGNTIYISDASGNTVKVTLSSATKVTKSLGVSKHSLRPGDTVVVRGVKNSSGKVSATSISDSGASSVGASATGGGSSNGSAGNPAVNSLFGSGRGG